MSSEKVTKGFKVAPETKQRVEQLFEGSGFEDQGEFLGHMASLFEMQQLKQGSASGYSKQIDELEYHTRRSVELFLSMIQTEQAGRLQLNEEHAEKVADLSGEISAQQEEIRSITEDLRKEALAGVQLRKDLTEAQQLIEALQKNAGKDEEIIGSLRKQVEQLGGIVAEQQEAAAEAGSLRKQLAEAEKLADQQARQLLTFQEAARASEKRHTDEIESLARKHADELERASDRASRAQEAALLALERKLMTEHTAERSDLDREIRSLQKVHAADLRKLYDEMDKLRQQLAAAQAAAIVAGKKKSTRSELAKVAERAEGETE